MSSLGRTVAALAARVGPADAARLADPLVKRMREEMERYALEHLVQATATLATVVGPADATRLANLLVERMRTTIDGAAFSSLEGAVVALSASLAAVDAVRLAGDLVEHMRGEKDGVVMGSMGRTAFALAARSPSRCVEMLFEFEPVDPRNDRCYRMFASATVSGQMLLASLPSAEAARWFDRLLRHPHAALGLARGDDREIWATALDRLPLGDDPARFAEWLKAPTCVGLLREAVLKQAGRAAGGREFRTTREFVVWDREHRPELDLTALPRRDP